MRFLKKLLLIVLIFFGLIFYYRLCDFKRGFATASDENITIKEVVGIKDIYTTKLIGDNYIVVLQSDKNSYVGFASKDDLSQISNMYAILGVNTKNLSIIPAVAGVVVSFIILLVPARKKD